MTTALIISNIILWFVVIGLLILVFALARQIGVLHERVAPVGALMPMNGPKIGEKIPAISTTNLIGETILLGDATDHRVMIYFLSPGCPVCKSLLPVVQGVEDQEPSLYVIYASDGELPATHEQYARQNNIAPARYVLSRELGITLGVNKLPFAVLLDTAGVLRARGLVNSREHLESLLTADEMDVSSLQEYLDEHEKGDRH